MEIKKRLYLVMVAVTLVILAGTGGYYLLFAGKYAFIDCLYMTMISLTTVGYGEIVAVTGNAPAQIFTMVLITFGMGIIAYGVSTLSALLIEGELTGMLRGKKMLKEIAKLKNHYIVCGGGETGRHVITELMKNQQQVVFIEQEEETIERCRNLGDLLYIKGDATEDHNLLAAGIERASGIIICLASDKDTLYVTMTARIMNRDIRIISRMIDQKLEPKLRKAGADSVVCPNFIGGLRMASEMIRPTVVDFLDSMLRSNKGNLRINQFTISQGSTLAGRKLSESGLKEDFSLLVLGIRKAGGDIEFNPPPNEVLTPALTLIVMGEAVNVARAKSIF